MKQWYAVHSKPRQEAIAEENLARQGYEVYLPRICLRKRKRGSWTKVVEPLFPRYLFIRVDPEETSIAPIRSTFGVAALVRFGHLLRAVPDGVIQYLRQVEDPTTQQRVEDAWPHQSGEVVAILDGPFSGLAGVFQMPRGEDRALLLVELLGRTNRIEVQMEAIA